MSIESITRNFQSILDGRGHKVRGFYLGGRRLGIAGASADVAAAAEEIGQIYDVVDRRELNSTGEATAVFQVPSEPEAAARTTADAWALSGDLAQLLVPKSIRRSVGQTQRSRAAEARERRGR